MSNSEDNTSSAMAEGYDDSLWTQDDSAEAFLEDSGTFADKVMNAELAGEDPNSWVDDFTGDYSAEMNGIRDESAIRPDVRIGRQAETNEAGPELVQAALEGLPRRRIIGPGMDFFAERVSPRPRINPPLPR